MVPSVCELDDLTVVERFSYVVLAIVVVVLDACSVLVGKDVAVYPDVVDSWLVSVVGLALLVVCEIVVSYGVVDAASVDRSVLDSLFLVLGPCSVVSAFVTVVISVTA